MGNGTETYSTWDSLSRHWDALDSFRRQEHHAPHLVALLKLLQQTNCVETSLFLRCLFLGLFRNFVFTVLSPLTPKGDSCLPF